MTTNSPGGPQERFFEKLRRKTRITLTRTEALGRVQQRHYLKRLFPLLDIDLVLDIGANRGQFAQFLRRDVGYKGPLVSFEPIPELAAYLQRLASRDKEWAVINAGVGDAAGRLNFNVMRSSPLSSFLAPTREHTDNIAHLNQIERVESVDVLTIDAFLRDERPQAKNIYLKLDVQGYEERCLDGALDSLPKIPALQAEMAVIPLYADMPSYLTLMSKIDELGYALSLTPAHPASQFPEIIDLDMHYVRRDRLRSLGRTN
jgi:FkbM family methyltransferase